MLSVTERERERERERKREIVCVCVCVHVDGQWLVLFLASEHAWIGACGHTMKIKFVCVCGCNMDI